MGEFAGIDPAKAHELIRAMETAKTVLSGIRPQLERAIVEAGADWADTAGTAAMHRAWAFFNDSQKDLNWRITTITQSHAASLNGAARDGAYPRGMLTGAMPYASQAEAAAAGTAAGSRIATLFKAHMDDASPDNSKSWKSVEAAIEAVRAGAVDPAFSKALLTAVGGPAEFRSLFSQWMTINTTGPHRGLSPEGLKMARTSLAPLAAAFASADMAGFLDQKWQKDLLEQTNPATLSTLLVLAPQSEAFLNKAAMRLLQTPPAGFQGISPDADWNTHRLLEAYAANPAALRTFLASDPKAAAALFNCKVILQTSTPGFEKLLANVLDKALDKNSGIPAAREQAWINVINELGREEDLTGGQLILRTSPINTVLAKQLSPYLLQLSLGQVAATSPELGISASGAWKQLNPDIVNRFLGAIMQEPDAVKILQAQFKEQMRTTDIGQAHPFSSDPKERAKYTRMSATMAGAASLLLGGSTYAELDDDQFNEFIADIATIPVDYLVSRGTGNLTAVQSTAVGKSFDPLKNSISDMVKDYLDGNTPDTASTVADRIVTQEVAYVVRSLQEHDQVALTTEDKDQITQAFRGRLFPVLVKALENRGG